MGDEHSFEALLAQVRQGDEAASAELVRLYEPEVRRFVHYRLSSPRMRRLLDSVDICQSVFANFFVRVTGGQFDLQNPRQLQQLLMTMAGNKVLDHVRKLGAARRGGLEAEAGGDIDWLADSGPTPGQVLEERELVDVVRARLSAEEQQLLDQWMHGDDWAQIARRAGASAEAVRKRFTRALDRVAQEMGWGEEA
jgi:RNA polymerase sigma-70 factor (ECF subfamily)